MGSSQFYHLVPVPSQVEGLLSEWVRHYHVPGRTWDADKIYAAYVARVGGGEGTYVGCKELDSERRGRRR